MKNINNTNDGARTLAGKIAARVVDLVATRLGNTNTQQHAICWGIDAFEASLGEREFSDLVTTGTLELIAQRIEREVKDALREAYGCDNVRYGVQFNTMYLQGEHFWTPEELKAAADKVLAGDPLYTEMFENWHDSLLA